MVALALRPQTTNVAVSSTDSTHDNTEPMNAGPSRDAGAGDCTVADSGEGAGTVGGAGAGGAGGGGGNLRAWVRR